MEYWSNVVNILYSIALFFNIVMIIKDLSTIPSFLAGDHTDIKEGRQETPCQLHTHQSILPYLQIIHESSQK